MKHRQEKFVAVHYSELQKEMALGQGEKLEAFAVLMGCNATAPFANMAKKSYANFFSVPATQPAEFVERVRTSMKANSQSSKACHIWKA